MSEYIRLGYPLDQLMNNECPFPGLGTESGQEAVLGGIRLPKRGQGVSSLNTGNIVIRGRPGTGKSTLALQIAVACAQSGYLAAYYSLELPAEKVLQKAEMLGWGPWLRPVEHLHRMGDPPSREELGRMIMQILTQPKDCPLRRGSEVEQTKRCRMADRHQILDQKDIRRRILLPSVSPRRLDDDASDTLFWARLRQIENMLKGAEWLEEEITEEWLETNYGGWVSQEREWLARQIGCLGNEYVRISSSLFEAIREETSLLMAIGEETSPTVRGPNQWRLEKCREQNAWFMKRRDTLTGLSKSLYGLTDPLAPRLRVVCIDSLNVFGEKPLTREHLFRVFDLFSRNHVIGVFIVEEDVAGSSDFSTSMGDDTIDYLADTVISLEHKQDKDYSVRHLEVVKSRYQPSVDGKHPYKLRSASRSQNTPTPLYEPNDRTGQALLAYPSLHHVVRASERQERPLNPMHFDAGADKLKQILPKNLIRPSVVTIAGPRGTFKTKLGIDFLMKGLTVGESGLLIRLHDRTSGEIPTRVSRDLSDIRWKERLAQDAPELAGKVMRRKREFRDLGNLKTEAVLLERAFKSGYLLPEEFIDEIAVTMNAQREIGKPIQRVVLDDVSVIGLSYPFLYSNHTAGDLFLPAFVHLMRIYGVDLVITGTTGDLDQANEYVKRATAIADAVLSCDFCDVFGERYVTITGEGLEVEASGIPGEQGEMAPGVFRLNDDVKEEGQCPTFHIDLEHLRGLVGFDTKNIHRPGLSIHCFEEVGNIHHRYNNDIAKLLQFAFASPPEQSIGAGPPDVSVVRFNSRTSAAVADSLGVLGDAPINRTVICTLDEFWKQDDTKMAKLTSDAKDPFLADDYIMPIRDNGTYVRPYYGNVLLLAYRCEDEFDEAVMDDIGKVFEIYDSETPPRPVGPESWADVSRIADLINKEVYTQAANKAYVAGANYPETERPFEVDLSAPETIGCAVFGALLAGGYNPDADTNKDFTIDDKQWKALAELLRSAPKHKADDPRKLDDPDQISRYRALSPDSAVYLCWYSQLRELVYSHPELAHRLKVCPIPGGGFTGDWYIGVTKGSLSASLGSKVVKILTDPTEDYKRFGRGVGLPAHKGFENAEFSAWPNSQQTLKHVLGIHNKTAKSRSDITERYSDIRRALYNAGQELLVSDDCEEVLRKLITQLNQLPLKPTAKDTGTGNP